MRSDVVARRLGSLAELAKRGKRINGLFRLLGSRPIWERAYEAIAPNKGALTPGVDPSNTLDGFSLERLEDVISRVMAGTYRFSPARRVHIPKPNGKKRPLGIPSADDKLVQAAVKIVLDHVYEPIFSARSHGFRRGRSCHTALDEVRRTWNGAVWLIDVDVAGFFDNIDHGILIDLLARRIDDDRFLRLVKGMLAAGYVEDWRWHPTHSGSPQGGVISSLLANVYLHELDGFVERTKAKYDRGDKRRLHPEYRRCAYTIANRRRRAGELRRRGEHAKAEMLLGEVKALEAKRRDYPSVDPFDPDYRRLMYVRYADDFLVGVVGPRREAGDVMDEIRRFLADELALTVSKEKSGITSATKGATFLGYAVRTHNGQRMLRFRGSRSDHTTTRRGASRRLQLHVPEAKLAAFVGRNRLGNYHLVRGEHRAELAVGSDLSIVLAYNALMRGLAEYYKLGTLWKQQLSRVHHLWWFSLMKTLANKHKCSVKHAAEQVLDRDEHGELGLYYDTSKGRRFVRVFKLKHVIAERIDRGAKVDLQPRAEAYYLAPNDVADRLKARECHFCGAQDVPLEVHHVRRLADVKDRLEKWIMAGRNRKRVPACRPCHVAIHAGRLQQRLDRHEADRRAG